MDGIVTALTTALPVGTFYDIIASLVPWIAIVFVVSLVLYFVRRAVKGGSKAKVKF